MKKISASVFIFVVTLFTQTAGAGTVKVGDYTIHCEMQGKCVVGGNPRFSCTFVVDNILMNTTFLAPRTAEANLNMVLDEKELKGTLTSYYSGTCGVRGDFKTTSPNHTYRGDI